MAADVVINIEAQDNFSSTLGNFGNIMTGIMSTINLVGEAFNAAKDAVMPFIDAAADSQVKVAQLETVLKSTGGTFSLTSQQLQDMATNMMNLSGFSDEAEMSAETMLLRFENLNGIFPQALQLTNDLARSLGIDLTTAAQTIGKALDDPASGIGRLNTQFKLFDQTEMDNIKTMAEHGDVAGAQALIMERLTEKVGGAADAYGKTFSGSLDIAKEKLDNVKEQIGNAMLPTLTNLLNKFSDFLNSPAVQDFLKDVADGIQTAADKIDTFVNDDWPKLKAAFDEGGISAVVSLTIGDVTEADVNQFLNDTDDKLAAALSTFDWSASGAAFGQSLENSLTGGGGGGQRQWYENIPAVIAGQMIVGFLRSDTVAALGAGIASWFYAAVGVANWDEFKNRLGYALTTGLYNKAMEIGQSIGDGLRAGFIGNLNLNPIDQWFYDHLVAPVKRILGIASPSTVFMDIGKDIINGLINGINSLETWAIDQIKKIVASIISPFKPILDFLHIDTSFLNTSGGSTSGTNALGGIAGTGIDRNAEGDFTLPTGTGTTTGVGGTGACVFNNYGTIYVGSMAQLYECPSPHPLLAASGATLLNTTIVP